MCKQHDFERYTKVLQNELHVSMGCTEPVAIAYCAAYARKTLGMAPVRCEVLLSKNMFKNAHSVTVPNTGGRKGVAVAALAGVLSGNPALELEVLSGLAQAELPRLTWMIENIPVEIKFLEGAQGLHIVVRLWAGCECAEVEIIGSHTGVCRVEKNGEKLYEKQAGAASEDDPRQNMSVRGIIRYAENVPLDMVSAYLERQIAYNAAIAEEGLANNWGCRVGAILGGETGNDIRAAIKAAAAAGSDARMNGCPLPVVINSGSGNQGITVSMPVIIYAKKHGMKHDDMLRALCISNLIAIHQKKYIGALSAYCGAVCAATGSIAAIAWLSGAGYDCISRTIINSIATSGGIICDGAKSSCAAKISLAIDGALTAYAMAKEGMVFAAGDGIVTGDVEDVIYNMGRVAAEGMAVTDDVIVSTMLNSHKPNNA